MKPSKRADAKDRIGSRRSRGHAHICPECGAAGFHKKACSQRVRSQYSADRWRAPP